MNNEDSFDIFREFLAYLEKKYGWFILPSKIENSAFILGKLIIKFGLEKIDSLFSGEVKHDFYTPVDEEIMDLFSVNETYFNREPETLGVLRDITRDLLKRKETVKIFCAASSSGEEIFSVAIALGDDYQEGRVTLTGGEISLKMIKMMEEGAYTEWSLRTCSEEFKMEHFYLSDKKFYIKEKYKKHLIIKRHNLLSQNTLLYFGEEKFDIILCRNLFLYMQPSAIDRVTQNLLSILEPGGFFITGLAEGALSERLKTNKYESHGNIFRF